MDCYPQNTVAQYTTKLNSSIELDGEWEVDLTEISFPFSIENVVDRECYFKISHPEFDTYTTSSSAIAERPRCSMG